ncbi:tetratricopeptide repeat protein [bacterium]|nr:tetratricopeptide repeat protein [bacterium]
MTEESFKRKLTAVLSADVAGYSRLMSEDEASTVKTITTYRGIMATLIKQHRGRMVDSPGDNVLAEFPSVVDAVQCAVAVQKEFHSRNAELPDNRKMDFRIGINLGDVIEEDDRIYGDGVNIAARLEALADTGGICVSKTAFDQIETKLPLGYEYLGEQSVKNIAKPVGAYRVLMEPRVTVAEEVEKEKPVPVWRRKSILAGGVVLVLVVIAALIWNYYFRLPKVEPASVARMAHPLPDKPSIAVLPFTNMSDDPKQEYFSDGITENVITGLSKIPNLFVIARNSTFTYKGKPVKVKQVAEEQGVRYVLEGSVQKSGDRVRISAQLVDAITGHHLWSDLYDRELKYIFALQDEITMKVTRAMQVKLTAGEQARLWGKGTDNLKAFLKVLEGRGYQINISRQNTILARKLFEEAISLDPEYAEAYARLAATHWMDALQGRSKSRRKSLEKAHELVQKALALDDSLPIAHQILGNIYAQRRQYDKAIAESERALALDPNGADAHRTLGLNLTLSGRPEEAIPVLKKALRLNPFPPVNYFVILGDAYRMTGRYEEAIAIFEKAINMEPDYLRAHLNLAATYIHLGREEEARAEAAEVLRINPKFSLERLAKGSVYKKAALERYFDALRKAGLPDKPPLPLPDKPSIAVLPFTNLSNDPEQEYFSDGITEDIITALSKVPKLFVIARNSTFTYKGKPVKVQQVGRELGVRYVLEGSIQKAKDRLRITAQLVDATTGSHIWAERYDRDLKDIFALQDEITMKIITAMQVKLTEGERARLYAKGTDNLDAYLKSLQGHKHFFRLNPDDHILARRYFKEAIALDPEFAIPYVFMGYIHLVEVRGGWSKSPQKSIGQAFKLAQKVLVLDESHPSGHGLLGQIHLIKGQHEKAIAALERAVALEPNGIGSLFWLGGALSNAGRPQEAIPHFKRVIRLNPLDPSLGLVGLGSAYNRMERYEEAITVLKKALYYQPDFFRAHLIIAGCYAALGREEEAHAEAAEVLRLNPKFSVKKFAKRLSIRDKAVKERVIDALRKAGLPD